MAYLIAQMLFCLLVTALLGAIVGWVARELLVARERRKMVDTWREQLRQSEARAGSFKNQLAEANQAMETLRSELRLAEEAAAAAGTPAAGPPAADSEAVESLKAELARRDKKIELLQLQISQSEAAVKSEWQSLKELKTEIAERQRRLDSLGKQRQAEWSGKLTKSEETRQKLQKEIALQEQRQARLERELETSAAHLVEHDAELEKLRGQLQERDASIARLNEALERTAGVPQEDAEKDDLEKIRGIGPVMRKKLNELGIHSFGQIASWTDDDIAWAASKIGSSPARIRKAGWVASAAKLLKGERPKRRRTARRRTKKS